MERDKLTKKPGSCALSQRDFSSAVEKIVLMVSMVTCYLPYLGLGMLLLL